MAVRLASFFCLGTSVLFTLFARCAFAVDPPALRSSQTAASASANSLSLLTDTRLDRLIDLQETAIPFDELLLRYSSKDLSLKAARDCASQKIQVRLKHRPLRVLMQSLAELLPGTWTLRSDGSGYYFEMSARAMQWREDWWQLFLGERKKAEAAQRAYMLQKLREAPQAYKQPVPGGEQTDPDLHAQTAAQQDFFRSLPADLQEKLVNGRTSCPLFTVGMGAAGTGYNEGSLMVSVTDLPSSLQDMLRHRCAGIFLKEAANVDMSGAMLRLVNGGFALDSGVVFPDGRDIGTAFTMSADISPNALPILANPDRLEQAVTRMGENTPIGWKQLAAAAHHCVWKNDPPAKAALNSPPYRRVDLLQRMGNAANMEYVADYYTLGGLPMPEDVKSRPLMRPLREELNTLAQVCDTSWKQTNTGITLLRHNRWYWLDHTEADAPTLRQLFALYTALHPEEAKVTTNQPPPTPQQAFRNQLAWNSEAIKRLTIWQITTGMGWFAPQDDPLIAQVYVAPVRKAQIVGDQAAGLRMLQVTEKRPFYDNARDILMRYATFQFYAELNEGQRTALLQNQLEFALLSPAQQEQALYLVPALSVLLHRQETKPLLLGLTPNAKTGYKGGQVNLVIVSS